MRNQRDRYADSSSGSYDTRFNSSRTSIVTQSELNELSLLKEAKEKYDTLRRQVLEKISRGSQIEFGQLCVQVIDASQRRFTKENLADLIGDDQMLQLWSKLPEIEYQKLMILQR